MAATVTLQLADPDSMKLLRQGLENTVQFYHSLRVHAEDKARQYLAAKQADEGRRHERRRVLAQQLLQQLPPPVADLKAPMGER